MNPRYMLFAGDNYYPSGGMDDFQGSFGSVMEAVKALEECDWFHVYDTVSGETHAPSRYSLGTHELMEWARALDDAAANSVVEQGA